ncbi:hypothetical protein ABZS81_30610 [Streptomyces sp. NPDC005318]|uniref:PIG-L deacetylase family protein n=1 Tax=Streptomyces sp. NPDC005318 TaxID=3157031 RepID=UPI0033B99C33
MPSSTVSPTDPTGFSGNGDDIALRIADVIREVRPDLVIGHCQRSIHSDRSHASLLAGRGCFLAGLPLERELPRRGVRTVLYAENLEDQEGFEPDRYVLISGEAFARWRAAIARQAFARGETYGFRYIDYCTALMTMRGCLCGVDRACALSSGAAAGRSAHCCEASGGRCTSRPCGGHW